ncbi:Hpt domain-containing protein [Gemmata obscuriglobus]|uniref:Hpt domain-containing protein n=1 Tax=Gemmata obscuriglobus TaxID=114 RepID=UPI00137C2B2A|nr:Hpt domain-containing protein [Gemmata obscuriglobus]VTS11161.1 signal transduction histidine kinase : CheA signal transduction histidine kinase OS=Desulfobulbus propionicus (strain ATCC 33891 / DSM 2032 / 1pr3) GN=Despr_2340 PE=4 SV=1: Hpt [Gemmata obscuriglobus UQM 2246]
MSQLNRELILGFVAEAAGYLPAIRAGVATLRAGPGDPEVLHEAYRCVHIIKGASSMVGLAELSHFAFALEEVVELLMHEPDEATPELLDGIEGSIAHIEAYLAGARGGADRQPELAAAALGHAQQLRSRTRSGPPAPPPAAPAADGRTGDEGRGPDRPAVPPEGAPAGPGAAPRGRRAPLTRRTLRPHPGRLRTCRTSGHRPRAPIWPRRTSRPWGPARTWPRRTSVRRPRSSSRPPPPSRAAPAAPASRPS